MAIASNGRIGVIGSGLGGLASACTLAARGYSVVVFEQSDWLGGKAAVLEVDGYRFDMGPTILIVPSVLRRIFAEANRRLEDELDLLPLDPQWRSFFTDGSTLDLTADMAEMTRQLSAFAPESATSYQKFMSVSEGLHQISKKYFFWRNVGKLSDMFHWSAPFNPTVIRDLCRMRPWRSVASLIRSHTPDPRVAQMLDHFTQYVGSAPDATPAVLCAVAHMQTDEGVWYPKGGTRAIPEALVKLARELGVEFRTNTSIEKICTGSESQVVGVITQTGEEIALSAVVSNSDSVRTHRELLEPHLAKSFEKRRGYEPACSGVVLYLGLKNRYEQLLHHNFVFSKSPEEEFEAIYQRGEPAVDPTCYVCAPACSDTSVAPPGGDALYVLVHTPYLRPHHNWDEMFPVYRKVIIEKLVNTAGLTDLESQILVERALTPADIHRRYRVLNGAIYGLASHGVTKGAFKPANRSPDVKGLYFAGGSAHPGPGMPMVMMSGWIAADTLDQDRLGNI